MLRRGNPYLYYIFLVPDDIWFTTLRRDEMSSSEPKCQNGQYRGQTNQRTGQSN